MFSQALTIAKNTFIEATRQPIVFVLVMLSLVFQIFNTWNTGFSMGYSMDDTAEVTADNKLLFDIGLSTVFVFGTILAAFVATAAISREIENKTVLTVISKPISRVTVILGKYLGVAGVLFVASVIMLGFLLIAIRHGVMQTAADEVDAPVLVFGGLGLFLVIGLSAWANYFYGWSFPQTAFMLLLPVTVVVYLLLLPVGKEWKLQPISKDFLSQVVTACAALTLAILVLASVATAASTRLGQVMTIVVCFGFFVLALLSNFLIGRHVFVNNAVAMVESVQAKDISRSFITDQEPVTIQLNRALQKPIKQGDALYFSSSPNGFPALHLENYVTNPEGKFAGDMTEVNDIKGANAKGLGVFAFESGSQSVTAYNIGSRSINMTRMPEKGDYIFTTPTKTRTGLLAVWGALPNLQYFWLLDAVSQNRRVPPVYLGLTGMYAGVQIVGCLAIAVMLFQRRDVG